MPRTASTAGRRRGSLLRGNSPWRRDVHLRIGPRTGLGAVIHALDRSSSRFTCAPLGAVTLGSVLSLLTGRVP
eukprot:1281993-Alexandrium_andersonii.AAC.1